RSGCLPLPDQPRFATVHPPQLDRALLAICGLHGDVRTVDPRTDLVPTDGDRPRFTAEGDVVERGLVLLDQQDAASVFGNVDVIRLRAAHVSHSGRFVRATQPYRDHAAVAARRDDTTVGAGVDVLDRSGRAGQHRGGAPIHEVRLQQRGFGVLAGFGP